MDDESSVMMETQLRMDPAIMPVAIIGTVIIRKVFCLELPRLMDASSTLIGICCKVAVDDLIVYKVRDQEYFIVVNAANKDKDFAWIKAHVFGDAEVEDISDTVGQIALQGPKAFEILKKLFTLHFLIVFHNHFLELRLKSFKVIHLYYTL